VFIDVLQITFKKCSEYFFKTGLASELGKLINSEYLFPEIIKRAPLKVTARNHCEIGISEISPPEIALIRNPKLIEWEYV